MKKLYYFTYLSHAGAKGSVIAYAKNRKEATTITRDHIAKMIAHNYDDNFITLKVVKKICRELKAMGSFTLDKPGVIFDTVDLNFKEMNKYL